MKFLIVTLALVCAAYAQTDEDWFNYQKNYGKYYRNAGEYAERRAKWEKNFRLINEHNKEFEQGLRTYVLGENEFADMSYEEFAAQRLSFKPDFPRATEVHQVDETRELRSSHSLLNHVYRIKDQGSCGSCWAFTATAAIELIYSLKNGGKRVDLSEQQLVDCNKGFLIFGNQGCNGGTFTPTFDYIKTNGLQSEASYPYEEKQGTCRFSSAKVVAGTKVTSYVSTTTEKAIIDAVAGNNPVAIGIYASPRFQLYKSGIYIPDSADANQNPNHAVLVVGYDVAAAQPHYVIKNSWSEKWGENGLVRLQHGVGALKITQMAVYPKL